MTSFYSIEYTAKVLYSPADNIFSGSACNLFQTFFFMQSRVLDTLICVSACMCVSAHEDACGQK